MDFDQFFEEVKYGTATRDMNDKARFKLANLMAHGYEIEDVSEITVLERDGELLMLDKKGNIWKAEKAI